MSGNVYIYILIMAAVSYMIRVIPIAVMNKPIENQFVQSFLYYVPYTTLAVMVFPSIIYATNSMISGIAALIVGILVAYRSGNLFKVAVACCAAVLLVECFL